ncbi:hypothetical protein CONLIGDRAFT_626376 [Coniochaeta ligniaria NRRL 30616]|uniref:Apple domain-containing protein n=1 Tax=Coniochaeta ligniaria NRRL 30616 TaxID=1408157 RepID=A0A1J7JY75_9PEZI|nr:hypothetical protein CONLIGDRAFT_626376 [Coniochaeta ligniaria NRRL 30616]
MLPRLLSAAALAAVASAQWASTSTTYAFDSTCSTAYGSTWVAPIPTSYSRTTSTISSVAPVETSTSTVYVTANTTVATPITLYSNVYTTTTLLLDAKTLTVTSTVSSTIATLTTKTTVCADGGPAPTSTATEYTGTYVPVSGQDTVLPSSYETADSCAFTESAILHIFPTTLASNTVTTTIPFSTASPTIWTTETNTQTVTQYKSTLTTTTTSYSYHVDLTTSTVSTACAATPTVTYAAQCAPQNLLAEFDGVGLSLGDLGNRNFTFGGVAGMAAGDPSLCCQLCFDNEGCVASVYWAQSSSCLLGYVGGDEECPVAFEYYAANYTGVPTKARQGNILQVGSGCGRIEYTGVHTS